MKRFPLRYVLALMLFLSSPLGQSKALSTDLSSFRDEKITYSIKKMGVRAGEATLSFKGLKTYQKKQVCLIIFTAKALNFFDEERIYVDPKTFYPITVTRDLNIFGKKESITEEYFPETGLVKITKTANGKKTEQQIKKVGSLDNIYSFIYRYRRDGGFNLGDTLSMHLPTKEISIELEKKSKIKAAGQQFDTYYMKSDPGQYQLWFDSSEFKIPIRINGAVGFGDAAMIMTGYQNHKGKLYGEF